MKNFLIGLLLAVFSLSAVAENPGYYCQVNGIENRREIQALKLPGYVLRTGTLKVKFDVCEGAGDSYTDFCTIKGHFLLVGNEPKQSTFITKAGKPYDFVCRVVEDQQQEQQEEQEQPDGEGPGHGGSTSGPRGRGPTDHK